MVGYNGTSSSSNSWFVLVENTIINNVIEFVTISTTGNATDFGDITQSREISCSEFSDVHGGLAQ